MTHTPATVRISHAPTTVEGRRADRAAADIWKFIDSRFEDDVDYWWHRKTAFRPLLAMSAYMTKEEGATADDVGLWLNAELTQGYEVSSIDSHSAADLAEGLEIIRKALNKGIIPTWLSEASGLRPLPLT